MEKLNDIVLKRLGYSLRYNESIQSFYYQQDDVIVWDTLGGFKYQDTGIILKTVDDLEREVDKEFN